MPNEADDRGSEVKGRTDEKLGLVIANSKLTTVVGGD
jgi:hypothetical protein